MAVVLRTNFSDILDPAFRVAYFDGIEMTPAQWPRIFHQLTSTKQNEQDTSVTAIGKWSEKSEGGTISQATVYQGYDVTYTHKTWSDSFEVTEEMWDDDQFAIMNKLPGQLGAGGALTVETECGNVFNNAFATAGGDGQPLCSASHPREDGGTALNNTATAILGETGLEAAIVEGHTIKSGKGTNLNIVYDTLVVGPSLEKEAAILMKSVLRPAYTDNDTNAYLYNRFKIIVWPELSTSTHWFLLDSRVHQLNLFWRKKPVFESKTDFDTGNAKFKGTMRFSVGFSDWRGVYGSQGTG